MSWKQFFEKLGRIFVRLRNKIDCLEKCDWCSRIRHYCNIEEVHARREEMFICNDCWRDFHDDNFLCDFCGNYYNIEEHHSIGLNNFCDDCFHKICFYCIDCDEPFYKDDGKLDEHEGCWYCAECFIAHDPDGLLNRFLIMEKESSFRPSVLLKWIDSLKEVEWICPCGIIDKEIECIGDGCCDSCERSSYYMCLQRMDDKDILKRLIDGLSLIAIELLTKQLFERLIR